MEIWLPYGDTEIVLDIKVENLLDNIKYQSRSIDDDKMLDMIDSIDHNANICLLDNIKLLGDLAIKIRDRLNLKGITTTLHMPDKLKNAYREYNVKSLDTTLYDKTNTILIARASYDPLFGYDGVPAKIVRSNKDIMQDIVKNVKRPSSGKPTDALSIAYKHLEHFESKSIEVIINNNIINMVIDEPIKANQEIIKSLPKVKSNKCKAIVIGSGHTYTLAESLRALWNCIDILKDESNVILLAEGSNGLGSEALDMVVQGKIEGYTYIDLTFLNWAKTRYNISLVTSLPDYYAKMIGFKAFRSINHALKYVIAKNPRQKITIVQDASNMLLLE
jgi:hypothetical protein